MGSVSRACTRSAAVIYLLVLWASSAAACDDFASKLIRNQLSPVIEGMSCGPLGRSGLDVPEHELREVCYSSSGPESQFDITVGLKCRTGDKAFISAPVSETVSATAIVRGEDCQILSLDLRPSSKIGKVLAEALKKQAREALQSGLNEICRENP